MQALFVGAVAALQVGVQILYKAFVLAADFRAGPAFAGIKDFQCPPLGRGQFARAVAGGIAAGRPAASIKNPKGTAPMLRINNLHVKLEEEDKQILKGVDLTVEAGRVHAIMGPNGSGKSTLSYVLSGRDGYEVTQGSATLDGVDLLAMEAEERAAAGLFLAFQYPVEIPGVGNMTFLRTALNAQRKSRGQDEISAGDFLKLVREKAKALKIDADMLKRPVNVGFSGGEKKRNEILQMAMLEPKMCILDETDSGLDVDAMKLVADGVNALRDAGRGFLVITHYQRLLDHIAPDVVHIMAHGRIVKTGGPELALEVEKNGYADILSEVA